MEFILRDSAGGASLVIAANIPAGTTLDELADHLRPYHRGDDLYFEGVGVFGPTTVAELGLDEGSVISVGYQEPTPSPPTGLRLRFESGPRAGETVPLRPGEYLIGRERSHIVVPDAEMSRQHTRLVVSNDNGSGTPSIVVQDVGSSNGTAVDGARIGGATPFAVGQVLTMGRTRCSIAMEAPPDLEMIEGDDGTTQVRFQKRVDVYPLPGAVRLGWPSPLNETEPMKFPIAAVLAPLVMSILMAIMMKRAYMLVFALMSPVMAATNYFSERKRSRRRRDGEGRRFAEQTRRTQERMEAALANEARIHRSRWPSIAETVETARCRSGRLWQRRPEDDDVTEVRIGTATRPARSVEIEAGRDADVPPVPDLTNDPIGLSMIEAGNLGVQGPDDVTRGLVRSLLLQLATYHPPHQLTMSAVFRDGAQEDFEWVRWLPHFRSGEAVDVGNTPESAADELDRLARIVEDRTAAQGAARGAHRFVTHIAVIEDTGLYDPAITDLILGRGPQVGVHCIVVERGRERIPGPCRAAVNLAVDVEGVGWTTSVELVDSTIARDVEVEIVSAAVAETAARSMAPLVPFAITEDRGGGIPHLVRLIDQIGVRGASPSDVLDRWEVAPSSTSAVIGMGSGGPVGFDLAMTPHGLAGGTTGTGKSQLLISMVGSLAAANSPEELNFVLVDFKGGGAFHRSAELPHTVSMLTNLTGDVARTIQSLDVELTRREALFRPYDASLVNYEKARRADPSIGPKVPRLVVIIDEYAEFIGDHDEMEEELESIARKGRSVGMHLILGTQAPSQAIRGKIDAQLELGIALRLKDPGESLNVIKDPAAAELPIEPRGRAYMRTAGPPVEFQVATLALPSSVERQSVALGVIDRPWAEVRNPAAPPTPHTSGSTRPDDDRTDLDELVDLIVAAAREAGLATQESPVLELLPVSVGVEEVAIAGRSSEAVPMWLEEHVWERRHIGDGWLPEHGNLLIAGAPGSGRTFALRTIAAVLADSHPADELHIQVFDLGGALLALEDLPHVGTVAPRTDRTRVERLAGLLMSEIDRRRELIVTQNRAGSLWELRARPGDHPPVIVVLFDQWEQTHQSDWDDLGDTFMTILKEGPSLGIVSVIATDMRRLNRVIETTPNTIALRLADRGFYPEVLGDFIKARDMPLINTPGRGLRVVQHDTGTLDVIQLQFAHLGATPEGVEQSTALELIASRVAPPQRNVPYRIDALTSQVPLAVALSHGPPAPSRRSVPIGVGGDQLQVIWHDLDQDRVLAIAGDSGSGRTTALTTARSYLIDQGIDVVTIIHDGSDAAARTAPGRQMTIEDLPDQLDTIAASSVVFIDDLSAIDDSRQGDLIDGMVRDEDGPAMVVTTLADNLRGLALGPHRTLATRRTGIVLNPQRRHDEVLGLRADRGLAINGPPGRAFAIRSGSATLVQMPTTEIVG